VSRAALLCLGLVLSACGVDGPPSAPPAPDPEPRAGVTISGSAQAGVIYRER